MIILPGFVVLLIVADVVCRGRWAERVIEWLGSDWQ